MAGCSAMAPNRAELQNSNLYNKIQKVVLFEIILCAKTSGDGHFSDRLTRILTF